MKFYIMTNIAGGGHDQKSMSGGDRINLTFIKKWVKEGHQVKLFTGKSGQTIYEINDTENIEFIITSSFLSKKFSHIRLIIFEIVSLVGGCKRVLKINHLQGTKNIIYSASDFWPDSVPAFILKLRNPDVKWIAGFYLFAPKPWQKDSPYRADFMKWLIGLLYWLTQFPIYYLVKKHADYIFVTSEPDIKRFITKKRSSDKIVVIRGGVDTREANEYLNSTHVIPIIERRYDAVFIGRFHYQKGTLELIDIWQLVCNKKPDAKLAMIGVGSLEKEIKEKIRMLNLEKNIELLGFKDGEEKYEIFKQSKIVVHPATYDSGGMAACEAMAWGLPGVSFDLEALKTYYPKGMLKTWCYDLNKFADNIIELLENKESYGKNSRDATNWAREWAWDKKAEEVLQKINVQFGESL